MEEEWIIPFKGRNKSAQQHQNFLWQKGSIYVMDNHRAAMWCWLQHLDMRRKYNLVHIDAHRDTHYSGINVWKQNLPDLRRLTIEEYLCRNFNKEGREIPVIDWGNYLSIFLELFARNVNLCMFATHGKGDKPRCKQLLEVECGELAEKLRLMLDIGRCIVNIDLDYFFCDKKQKRLICNESFIFDLFQIVRHSIDSGAITVVTIALSPECCGGWKKAETLFSTVSEILSLDFFLPRTRKTTI